MSRLTITMLLAACFLPVAGQADAAKPTTASGAIQVPVMVGVQRNPAQCNNGGMPAGRRVKEGADVPLYEGRVTQFDAYGEKARLHPGQYVYVCQRNGGYLEGHSFIDWAAIVVGNGKEDCGSSVPLDHPQAYDGPCFSGWVRGHELDAALE